MAISELLMNIWNSLASSLNVACGTGSFIRTCGWAYIVLSAARVLTHVATVPSNSGGGPAGLATSTSGNGGSIVLSSLASVNALVENMGAVMNAEVELFK